MAQQQEQQQQQMQTQTGILLLQNGVVPPRIELPVPRPPPPPALPNPRDYAHLLPDMPVDRLRAWVAPPTTKLGHPIVIIAERPRQRLVREGGRELNGAAVYLTVDLQDGFGEQICGSALALFAEPGLDLSTEYYDALDDVLRGPLMGYYETEDEEHPGAPPTEEEWRRLGRQLELGHEDQRRWKAEREADPASGGPRCASCCAAAPPSRCSRCRSALYCSASCQRKGWRDHKFMCASLAAAHGHAAA